MTLMLAACYRVKSTGMTMSCRTLKKPIRYWKMPDKKMARIPLPSMMAWTAFANSS